MGSARRQTSDKFDFLIGNGKTQIHKNQFSALEGHCHNDTVKPSAVMDKFLTGVKVNSNYRSLVSVKSSG
jgi:hypothetical protein